MTFAHRVAHDTAATIERGGGGRGRGLRRGRRALACSACSSRDVGDATSDPTRRDPRRLVVDLIDSLTRWELNHQRSEPDRHRRAGGRGPPRLQGARRGPGRHRHAAADGGAAEPRRRADRRRGRAGSRGVGVAAARPAHHPRHRRARARAGRPSRRGGRRVRRARRAPRPRRARRAHRRRSTRSGRWAQAAQQGLLQDLAGIRRAGCAAPCAPPATATRGRRSRPTWVAPPTRWPTRPRSGATSTPIRAPASTG